MSTPTGLSIICVGAGITGSSVAIAMRQHASSITLLEASESVEAMNASGAGIALHNCAINILRDFFDIDPAEDIKAVPGRTMQLHSWKNGLVEWELNPPLEWYLAHRGALLNALLKKATDVAGAGKPAKIVFGKRVVAVDPDAGTVTTFDGEQYHADLIIGSEGVRSITRRAIHPNSTVMPSGLSVYRFTLNPSSWAHLPVDMRAQIDALIGPESHATRALDNQELVQRLVLYRCHNAAHIVNGLLLLPDYALPQEAASSETWSAQGSVQHLRQACDSLPEPFKSIIGCVKDGEAGLWQLRLQSPLGRWSRGRAIVLGDAAHPFLPFQSAAGAMALEDAEALGFAMQEVAYSGRKEDISKALQRVYKLRWMRASLVQSFSNQGPFGTEKMEEAARWSEAKAREGQDQPVKERPAMSVPLVRAAADDPVQKAVEEMVQKHADVFDPRATSAWVWDYKGAKDWATRKSEFVLEKSFD